MSQNVMQKEGDLTQSFDKIPIPTKTSKTKGQYTNATKIFDYTKIADSLRKVSWSNNSHSTDVVYWFYRAHLPTYRNSCVITGKNMQILLCNI